MNKRILFLLVFIGLFPGLTSAQIAITGKITGVVTDSSGAAIPNATVTVKSTALMAPRNTTTSGEGVYLFDLLSARHVRRHHHGEWIPYRNPNRCGDHRGIHCNR